MKEHKAVDSICKYKNINCVSHPSILNRALIGKSRSSSSVVVSRSFGPFVRIEYFDKFSHMPYESYSSRIKRICWRSHMLSVLIHAYICLSGNLRKKFCSHIWMSSSKLCAPSGSMSILTGFYHVRIGWPLPQRINTMYITTLYRPSRRAVRGKASIFSIGVRMFLKPQQNAFNYWAYVLYVWKQSLANMQRARMYSLRQHFWHYINIKTLFYYGTKEVQFT